MNGTPDSGTLVPKGYVAIDVTNDPSKNLTATITVNENMKTLSVLTATWQASWFNIALQRADGTVLAETRFTPQKNTVLLTQFSLNTAELNEEELTLVLTTDDVLCLRGITIS